MLMLGENVYSQGAAKISNSNLTPTTYTIPSWPTRSITVFINLLYASNVPPAFQPGLALPYPLLTDCSAIHCLISFKQSIRITEYLKILHTAIYSDTSTLVNYSNADARRECLLSRGCKDQ